MRQSPIRSALARPLDPSVRTNRAVMTLLPVGALVAALLAWWTPAGGAPASTGLAWSAVLGAAVVLGGWALGRELAPDHQPAAFVALGATFAAWALVPGASVLVLFLTLMLARMVNRTVGVPASVLDDLVLVGFVGWGIHATDSPGVGVVGALAFALDARLVGGLPRQWVFATLCIALSILAMTTRSASPAGTPPDPEGRTAAVLATVLATTLLFTRGRVRTRAVTSVADATGAPLSPGRVRAAMGMALLMALQFLAFGPAGAEVASLLWAGLAGVAIASVGLRGVERPISRSSSPPAPGE